MDIILALGIMIVAAFFGGLLAHRLKFPRITGYIIVGVLLGPSVFNIISGNTIDNLDVFMPIALGIIAYSIGTSIRWKSIKVLEKSIFEIGTMQGLMAFGASALIITFLSPLFLDIKDATFSSVYLPMGLIIGAIASATAPAAVMAIIHEYKARGSLTTTLLAVVAFDDAIAIVLFSLAVGVAQPLVGGQSFSAYQTFLVPLIDIIGSIAIGTAFGFILAYLTRLIKIKAVMLVLVIGFIVLCVGVTEKFHLSGIMANMVIGFIVCNMTRREDVYLAVDDIEDLVFAIFFVLAGLHFELGVMKTAGLFAVLITISRFAGKYFGVMSGARMSGAPAVVRKYLGFALLPKAGVSIGLALLAESAFPSFGNIIFNGILASAIINELFSPLLVKYAIFKAGEQHLGS